MSDMNGLHHGLDAASEETRRLLAKLAEAASIPFRANSPPPPQKFITPDGVAISYLDWGGEGAPLLLLHGGSLTAHTWDLVCLALCDRFRCVAMDLRGHGLSDWTDNYTIDAHVSDVAAAVTHFGWDHLHIVGMSLGGNVAAHYAAKPDTRASSLVMVDVGPEVDFEGTEPVRAFMNRPIRDLTLDQLIEEGFKASRRGVLEKIRYRYLHMTRVDDDGRLAWRIDRRRPHDYAHILGKLRELEGLAPMMRPKVLVVRGALSRVLTEASVAKFAGLLRDGRWETVAETGHNVQEDNPQAFADAIDRFLL